MQRKAIELWVGLFVLLGIISLIGLGLKVSNLTSIEDDNSYLLYAKFQNIGGLKVRSPVKVGGVTVGRVAAIGLDPEDFSPITTLVIQKKFNSFSTETGASIMTAGILGEQFVSLTPGWNEEILINGDYIEDTQSALVLEELIAQFLFSESGN